MSIRAFEPTGEAVGCAVVAHGRNGAVDQPHMVRIVSACLSTGLRVVAPELCFSAANDSAGDPRDFTMAAHIADVKRAVLWTFAEEHREHAGPLILLGHSMGAFAAVACAGDADLQPVHGVIAISPVVSGRALLLARHAMGAAAVDALRDEVPAAFTEWPMHDLEPVAPRIAVPSAVIVGADDTLTPPSDASRLAHWLPRCLYQEVLDGEHHCPVGDAFERSLGLALQGVLED